MSRAFCSTAIRPGSTSLPQCGRAGDARDQDDGHVRRFVVVLRALHRSPNASAADDPAMADHWPRGRPVYRRHRARDFPYSLFALLHPRDAQAPAISASTSLSPAPSPRAWWWTRPIGQEGQRARAGRIRGGSRRTAAATFSLPAMSRWKSARTRRCRSPGATPSIRTRSSRPMAPTRRDGSCSPIRRPSATSSGPRLAFRARSSRRNAYGA